MNVLQIGCRKCQDHVARYLLENKEKISKLILVDLDARCIDHCSKVYKDIENKEILVTAITGNKDENKLVFYHKGDAFSSHTSKYKSHLEKMGASNIIEVDHDVTTVNDILLERNITKLDRLYIDTEGMDVEILESIDYDKYTIEYIMFEHRHIRRDEVYSFITKMQENYTVENYYQGDTILTLKG